MNLSHLPHEVAGAVANRVVRPALQNGNLQQSADSQTRHHKTESTSRAVFSRTFVIRRRHRQVSKVSSSDSEK